MDEQIELTLADQDRFWSHVRPVGDHWLWQGTPTAQGYGQFGVRGPMYLVHRIAFQLDGAELFEGFIVHHRCFVKLCVKPTHLEQVPRNEHPPHPGSTKSS
jgi:hypothetical protein